MKIAIFGGTFDPVHAEHINIVKAAKEKLGADKVIVMPAFVPPHKQGKMLTSAQDRLNMAKLAFAGIRGCEVSSYEMNAGGTSYTYRTVEHFRQKYPEAQLFWLVGADMLKDFYTWKNPEQILAGAELVACGREGEKVSFKAEQLRFFAKFRKGFRVLEYAGRDVSSTKIRVLCAFGEDLKPYLAEDVIAYIQSNGLYRVERVKEAAAYLKPVRKKHTVRVALMAAGVAAANRLDERAVIRAAGLHDAAKNLAPDAPELAGFVPPEPNIPAPVLHQYTGAYLAEHVLGETDADVLNAVRYHTSGRPNMSTLEKVIFLSDMLEAGRDFPHIGSLREWFYRDLNECMYRALKYDLRYLKKAKGDIYPLTFRAYEYYKDLRRK